MHRKSIEELEKKQGGQEGVFLLWQYERAKKALNTHNRRIADLKDFIEIAKRELEKKEKETAEEEIVDEENRGNGNNQHRGT